MKIEDVRTDVREACGMNYDPRAIANEFLDLAAAEGKTVDPMKLQKLVYYAYGWGLVTIGEPLFSEGVQAWKFGPVIPSVYYEFRAYGNNAITDRARDVISEPLRLVALPGEEACTESVRRLLKRVWDVYKKYSAVQLSNATHQPGTPWHQVYDKHHGEIPARCCIADDVIRTYFRAQAQ
jgi:uncharacterized phage-associated protein